LAISTILIFIFGLIIGSFLNVCIYRIPRSKSIISPGSFCPLCGKPIAIRDNIPVLSYILLRGRCRHCGGKIFLRYPAVELLTGFLFVGAYLKSSYQPVAETFRFPFYGGLKVSATVLFFLSTLILVSFIDLEHKIIPNKVILPATGIGILLILLSRPAWILESLIGSLIGGGFLLFIALLRQEGMGGGDIKLGAFMGIFLGRFTFLALFLGFLAGAVAGIVLILLKLKTRKDLIPFGPFLALGGAITLFFGPEIVGWYLRAFV